MAIACTVVTPASDVALSMAFMTQNVYAENIQTTFPDGWNKDDKDDKKDDKNNTGSGNTGTENNGNETGGGSGGDSGELGAAESPTPTPTLGAVESQRQLQQLRKRRQWKVLCLDYQNLIFRLINGRGQSVLAHWRILWPKVFTRCVTVKQKNHYYGIMTMM